MHAARLLALVVIVAGCPRQPSAELVLEEPRPDPEVASGSEGSVPKGGSQVDARMHVVCVHSYDVLASESPSLRSPDIQRDFIDRCIAGNQAKRSELGDQRWAARAACIERAQTGDDLGACDGRTPIAEPNPEVVSVSVGSDARALCQRLFDLLLAENPDMKAIFAPEQMGTMLEQCAADAEEQRKEDPAKFDRLAACFMAAKNVADLDACD